MWCCSRSCLSAVVVDVPVLMASQTSSAVWTTRTTNEFPTNTTLWDTIKMPTTEPTTLSMFFDGLASGTMVRGRIRESSMFWPLYNDDYDREAALLVVLDSGNVVAIDDLDMPATNLVAR